MATQNVHVKVLIDGVKALLEFRLVHLAAGIVRWVVVHIGQEDRLRERRLNVLARAPVSVSAGSNLTRLVRTLRVAERVNADAPCSRMSNSHGLALYRKCLPSEPIVA